MLWARSACALWLIRLANRCPGPGSRCAACWIAVCESLKIATIFTPYIWNVSLFSIVTTSASPIAHSSASKTSMHPVPRKLQRNLHWFPCLHTATAHTRLSSARNPSVHNIETPAPILASFSRAQRCALLLAAVVSSSVMVLSTDSSPGAGHIMPSVVWLCSCCFLTTMHISAPEEGFPCNSFSLLLHASASLAANRCCLESTITGVGISPDSHKCTPVGLWTARPWWTWLVNWGGVGGYPACLLPWDPTRAHSHIVRPLGHTPLGRPLHSQEQCRMSWSGFGVSLLLPWLSSCIICAAPWTLDVRPSRHPANVSPVYRMEWPCCRLLSLLSVLAGSVSCGLVCMWIVPPLSWQCQTVALVYLPTQCYLLRISQVSRRRGWHCFQSPPSRGRLQRTGLQLEILTVRLIWSVLRCRLGRGSVTSVSPARPHLPPGVSPWRCLRLSSPLFFPRESAPSII